MLKLRLETLCSVCESAVLGDDEDDGGGGSDVPELELSSSAGRPTIFHGTRASARTKTRIMRIITPKTDITTTTSDVVSCRMGERLENRID